MRILFYHASSHWSGSARAFSIAARGLASLGEPVTVVCRTGTLPEKMFTAAGLEVVGVPATTSASRDAWGLRSVLKDRFVEAVFLHTDREHLVASSAMRLAERGGVIRRIPAGCSVDDTRTANLAERMARSRLLFTLEEDRARASIGDAGFVAPLGVDVSAVENVRAKMRQLLGVADDTLLIVCAIDRTAGTRVTTAMRTLALLAERHPELRLALVGRDADADDTRMHAAALGVTSLVRFLGEREDAPQVLAAADVGWVASEGDDGGFACLDFMAAKVPIIAERSPLVSHFVPDGIAGCLLSPADPSDIASAVARFLADHEGRRAMGEAGYTRAARDFREKATVDGFISAAAAVGDRSLWAAR